MTIKSKLFFTTCLFLIAATAFAGTSRRKGTAGAQELLIPVGSAGTALSGAGLAHVQGIEAMYWNPAGLAAADLNVEAAFSHMNYIADIDVNYVAAAFQNSTFGALGLDVKSLGFGDIPVTTEQSPDGTGEMFSPSFITVGLTYSRAMTDRIFVGLTGKVLSEKIMNESANGIGFDIGINYISPVGIRAGIVMRNIGGNMSFDGTDLEVFTGDISDRPDAVGENLRIPTAEFELPTSFELGVAYDFAVANESILTLMGAFVNSHHSFDEYKIGAEFCMQHFLFLRGSYCVAYDSQDQQFRTTDASHYIYGPAFGAGIKLDAGSANLYLDYAYRITEMFDDNQWFSLRLAF